MRSVRRSVPSITTIAALFIGVCVPSGAAQVPEPSGPMPPVDPEYTWDLTELFPSVDAWDEARRQVLIRLEEIAALRGTLGGSAQALLRVSELISDTRLAALRVAVYANLEADEDLRVADAQERRQLSQLLFTRFAEATSWYDPEVLEAGRERIMGFVDEEPRLERFRFRLQDALRWAPHTRSDDVEEILAAAGQILAAGSNTYGLLANSDIPWPTVTLSSGDEARLDTQGYVRWRQAENRADRKRVFDAYWDAWQEFRNSVGMTLTSHLQGQVFTARARGFGSVLERELFRDHIPPAVFHTLVDEVNRALPTLFRYFDLRGRMLGVEQMHLYDVYPPLVSLDRSFSLDDARRITLEAMSVLGDDWVDMQREAMEERWMHLFPQRGKRSGAYMSGSAYEVHPYLLLNFQSDYESVSTFAHEWGHAMHTLYANMAQPFETAGYATFIAEIPSTTLELILQDYMVENASTEAEKLFYLGRGLEQLRGTFFRQTMFAEFELALYEAVERGEALSGARITEIYAELQRRYHGHDEGVVLVDELYTNEWAFIPHFYRNMYVYQYATSITAGTALYERIRSEGASAVEAFKDLLRAGGSDYPYELLRRAGVDMATPQPYRALVRRMNETMDEIEALLDQM